MASVVLPDLRSSRGPALLPSALAAETGALHEPASPGQQPRPFVIGYIDAASLPRGGPAAVTRTRARITRYADKDHLALGHIYVDYPGLGGSGFRALLIAAVRYNPQQILVPNLTHVATHADKRQGSQTRQELIEALTKARVQPLAEQRS